MDFFFTGREHSRRIFLSHFPAFNGPLVSFLLEEAFSIPLGARPVAKPQPGAEDEIPEPTGEPGRFWVEVKPGARIGFPEPDWVESPEV